MSIFDSKEQAYTKKQIKQVLDGWQELTNDKLKSIYETYPVLKNYNETQYQVLLILFGVKEKG